MNETPTELPAVDNSETLNPLAPNAVAPESARDVLASPTVEDLAAPQNAPAISPQSTPQSVAPIAPAPAPPRALTPGAFLRGEIEVKSVVSRGLTNIYEAASGDYGAMTPVLLAERENAATQNAPLLDSQNPTPQTAASEADPPPVQWENVVASSTREEVSAPVAAPIASTFATSPIADSVFKAMPLTVDESAQSGAFVEDVDTLSNAIPPDVTSPTGVETANSATEIATVSPETGSAEAQNIAAADAFPANETAPIEYLKTSDDAGTFPQSSSLFVAGENFEHDEREYKLFDFFASTSLLDWREPANDERLLQMLHALAQGLCELERNHCRAVFTTETLRVDANGDLKFLGFVDSGAFDALGELRRLAKMLMKQTFAEAVTMRLDDEYLSLALSEEVKNLARRLDADAPNAFQNANEAASVIASYTSSTRLRADFALLSDVGQERELNEDSGLIMTTNRQANLGTRVWDLYVVADGMGGHEGGEVASDLTMTSLVRNLEAQDIDFNDNVAVKIALVNVIDAVNAEVVALTETPKYKGTRAKPGSTLTFALRVGARVFVGNVGDSRTYKYANRVLERVSKDHSYVQTLIDSGEITEDEAFTHPDGSVITAHIGYPKLKQRDVFLRLFRAGETLLLVSDGVTDMLRDAEYEPHLQHEDAADVCRAFVNAANAAGGIDNITVICVKFR